MFSLENMESCLQNFDPEKENKDIGIPKCPFESVNVLRNQEGRLQMFCGSFVAVTNFPYSLMVLPARFTTARQKRVFARTLILDKESGE